ncbi:uncharacterized protein EV422DRAFT_374174 [Fimicolochytrium jonesii]|uniref:uncharacterized protein n=1 Tax=Fimicolochytrium jonesii TaxID=1396493 RepID=UPI0022FEE5A2|nr:uncharacterized protein EV422DRAFT_374174 [Fimicolochytrium jonesii]KAI8815531.1 hypothetical protein EV422DRAFT_374174 [Fimicolochytrium jonesii]
MIRRKREDRFTATTVFLPSGHGHNLDDVFHLRVPWGDARESCEVDRKDIAYVRTDDLLYWPPALPVPGSSSPPFLLTRLSIDVFSEREILAHEKVVRWLDETGIERFPVNGSTFQKDAVSRTKKDHPACSFAYVQLYDRSCMVRDGHSSTWQYFPDFVNYGCRVRPLDLVRLKECNGVSGNPGAVINSIYPLRLRIIRSPEMYLTALQNNESNSMPWYRSADDPTTLRLQEDREMHNKMFGDTASWKEYATVQIKIYTGHAMLIAVIMHNTYWFRLNSTVGLSRESIFLTTMMLFWVRILNGTSHLNWIAYIAFGLRLRAALHPYIWVSRRGVKWGCHELQENERRSQRMDEQVGWRTRWAIVLAVVLLKPLCEQIHLPSPLTPRGVWEFYRKQTQVTTAGFIFDSLQANFNSRTKLFAGSYKVVRILDGLAMLVMIVLEDTTAGFPWPTALLTVVHVYQAVIYPTPSQAAGWADEAHRD